MSYSNRAYIHSYCSLSIHYYNNFYFRSFFSLSSPFAQPTPSSSASSSEAHTPTDKIKNQPQNQQQNHPETPQNQTHPHMDTLTETERVDRRMWQIGVLGSECFSPCLDQRQREWIGVLGSECLDRRSSRHAWIRDRESGLALAADQRAWIGIILVMLLARIEISESLEQRGVKMLEQRVVSEKTLEQSLVSGEREAYKWREGLR